MDKQQAKHIIQEAFENSFVKERFAGFIKNLLKRIEEDRIPQRQGQFIPEAYRQYISTLERIGKFNDGENRIDILIVKLQKETSIERARTMQRNFVAGYLQGKYGSSNEKEAALVAFVSPDEEDWRFSLVKMDYKFEQTQTGRMKIKEEFTPARRWSFLVGKNETSHTAQSRLVDMLANDEHSPTLAELEQAFDIETVTKEFFIKYRELFIRTKEELDNVVKNDAKIKADFEANGVNTVDFAKKLLGQIVFLYFLQKKGWFGVGRDAAWGTGPKNFLRLLYEKNMDDYKNFFNDILEPLFYEALAIERTNDFYSRFDCKIPFLNGGLFDPVNSYDWVHTDILLPNELFSNKEKTKEGDIGTGIFDVFDRYNFTVREDEPLEKEVAIDPEMLGKVFENLLEVKDRKSKGTYYTPREIVHYMCQESLINYLDVTINPQKPVVRETAFTPNTPTQKKLFGDTEPRQLRLTSEKYQPVVPLEDIESFIRHGDIAIEHDVTAKEKHAERSDYNGKYKKYKLPEGIRAHAKLIDAALADIKICDPAIGSGAFPVGMMHEIVRARQTLTTYLEQNEDRTPYDFKRHAIQESLYGVDIDPGAVEIAKLRLWLSLVVDEEEYQTIKPLPNLDYKIVCGNSLLEVKQNLSNSNLFEEMEKLKPLYFDETNLKRKKELKQKIDSLIGGITENNKLFDFEVYFSDVFHMKGGFDVMIANPPYLRIQEIQKNTPELAEILKDCYLSASGNYDIYACFVELAIRLIHKQGNVAYILPHKFFQASFGKNLRKLISSERFLRKIVDFGSSQVFESATTYTCLLFLSSQNNNFKFAELKPNTKLDDLNDVFESINSNDDLHSEKVDVAIISNTTVTEKEWHFSASSSGNSLSKLKQQPRTLADVCDKIFQGIATSADKIYFLEHISEKDGVVKAFSKSLDREISIEKEFVKPLLKGADVHRYSKLQPKIWCIFPYEIKKNNKAFLYTQEGIKEKFPLAWRYLLENKRELENRERGRMRNEQFYAYIYPKNLTEFERIKIVTPDIASNCQMTIDDKCLYHTTTIYSFVFKENCKESLKYFLALLNSKLLWYFLTTTGSVLRGGFFRFKTNYLLPFPIPKELSQSAQKPFVALVDQILAAKQKDPDADTSALERQIDQMVYKLYGLPPEEIAIVERIELK